MSTTNKTPLNNNDFIDLLRNEIQKFSDDYFPLHSTQLKAIERCTALVDIDKTKIGDNSPKRRAKEILTDLWTHVPEAFLLCALATNPTRLGTLSSTDYMKFVLQWWEGIDIPGGLTKTMDRHSDALPSVSRDQRQVNLEVSGGALLEFIKQKFGDPPSPMALPFSGTPLPSVRLNRHVKIVLSWEFANSFTREYPSRS